MLRKEKKTKAGNCTVIFAKMGVGIIQHEASTGPLNLGHTDWFKCKVFMLFSMYIILVIIMTLTNISRPTNQLIVSLWLTNVLDHV